MVQKEKQACRNSQKDGTEVASSASVVEVHLLRGTKKTTDIEKQIGLGGEMCRSQTASTSEGQDSDTMSEIGTMKKIGTIRQEGGPGEQIRSSLEMSILESSQTWPSLRISHLHLLDLA